MQGAERNVDFRAPYIYAKALSLYLQGWTQESIAETDEKVAALVNAGAQEEEVGKARHTARMTTSGEETLTTFLSGILAPLLTRFSVPHGRAPSNPATIDNL